MRRTWTTTGEEFVERLGRRSVEAEVEAMVWETIPRDGSLEVGFLPGHSMKAAIQEFRIPKVAAVAISSFERPGFYPGFYGVEGNYSNGRARVYLLDTGTAVIPLLSDFWTSEEVGREELSETFARAAATAEALVPLAPTQETRERVLRVASQLWSLT